jgi:hypothetical protein
VPASFLFGDTRKRERPDARELAIGAQGSAIGAQVKEPVKLERKKRVPRLNVECSRATTREVLNDDLH